MDESERSASTETDRNSMDGSTLPEQHDNFQQQISNFNRLLQYAINRFSTEKLNHMLRALSKGISDSVRDNYPKTISSLQDLHDMIDEVKGQVDRRNTIHKSDEVSIAKYFEAFFEDLAYLKELKQNFDEKIYVCLYDYFYDPAEDVDGQYDISEEGEKHRDIQDALATPIEMDNRRALTKMPDKTGFILDRLNDQEKLSYAVSELFVTNERWDRLYEMERVDADCFDEDSYHELIQYKDYELYENVLRIVPDIFVKAHKSVELAKLWWTQANKLYTDLPKRSRNSQNNQMFLNKEKEMQEIIKELRIDIFRDEESVKRLVEELEVLKQREEKFFVLNALCEKMEMEEKDLEKRHGDLLFECSELNKQMEDTDKLSKDFQVLDYQLKTQEKELACVKNELQSLEYKLMISQSDLEWNMAIRPDMILFTADVSEKISSVEDNLNFKTATKRKYEKKITLLRTNCDRMRQIMRKHIKSVDAHESKIRSQEVMNSMRARFGLKEGADLIEPEPPQRMEVIPSGTEEDFNMGGQENPKNADDDVFDSGVDINNANDSSTKTETPQKEEDNGIEIIDDPQPDSPENGEELDEVKALQPIEKVNRQQPSPAKSLSPTKYHSPTRLTPQQKKFSPATSPAKHKPESASIVSDSRPSTRSMMSPVKEKRRKSVKSDGALLHGHDDVENIPVNAASPTRAQQKDPRRRPSLTSGDKSPLKTTTAHDNDPRRRLSLASGGQSPLKFRPGRQSVSRETKDYHHSAPRELRTASDRTLQSQRQRRSTSDRASSHLPSNYSLRSGITANTSPSRSSVYTHPTQSSAHFTVSRLSNASKLSVHTGRLPSPPKTERDKELSTTPRAWGAKDYYKRFKHHKTNDSILNRKPFPRRTKGKKKGSDPTDSLQ